MRTFLTILSILAFWLPARGAPLAVVPESVRIAVDVRATLHSFTGQLEHAEITISGDAATGSISHAEIRFAWADLSTANRTRDEDMRRWAGAERNPGGRFILNRLAPASDSTAIASGSLELAGQVHELSFPVTIVRTAGGWKISGEAVIDHRDWGLPRIRRFGILAVDPVVNVRFSIEVKAAG